MRLARQAAALTLALLAAWAGGLGAGDRAEEALRGRLRRIEAAFRQGDAAALGGCFSGRAKVRVEFAEIPRGLYGAGQLQVIFARLFERRRTRAMSFPWADVRIPSPETAFARASWDHVGARNEDERSDTLMLTLHAEEGDWRIIEMRSAR